MKEVNRIYENLSDAYAGIDSIEIAGEILSQLANFGRPAALDVLSERCHLSPGTAHRYLSSLATLGFVFQHAISGCYSLGRNAIGIGLANQHNVQIDEVVEGLPELVSKLHHHVFLSTWTKAGPTVVKWERSDDPIVIATHMGDVLPMTSSASGRLFAAFLNPAITKEAIEQQSLAHGDTSADEKFQSILKSVRRQRVAISRGEIESEITTIAVPIINGEGNAVAVVGSTISKNAEEDSLLPIRAQLTKFAHDLSIRRPLIPFPVLSKITASAADLWPSALNRQMPAKLP